MNLVPTGRKVTDINGVLGHYIDTQYGTFVMRVVSLRLLLPLFLIRILWTTVFRSFLTLRALPYPASKINYWD